MQIPSYLGLQRLPSRESVRDWRPLQTWNFSREMVSYFPREYILSDNNGLGDTFSYSRLRLRATTTEEVQ